MLNLVKLVFYLLIPAFHDQTVSGYLIGKEVVTNQDLLKSLGLAKVISDLIYGIYVWPIPSVQAINTESMLIKLLVMGKTYLINPRCIRMFPNDVIIVP